MTIEVKELCEVDYIHEDDIKTDEPIYAIRTVQYETNKESLLEAFEEYENAFDMDKMIDCSDEFDGECQNTIKTLSVKEIN